ncbi:MAG: M20/M25/M40 family metallo-hydrolase, partial [Wenzhouxiangella sp.]
MIKGILAVAVAAALVLTAVVVYRAVTWPSSQPEPAEVFHGEIREGAVERLAEALSFPTITWTDREFDTAVFDDFLAWIQTSYPLTHERLEVERHGGYSLLISWPGADASLDPVLLMAHYDVVPVEPGTEHEWTYPPFDGTIADGHVWGRGALDDKSGMTGILEAVESLLAEDFRPQRTILLAFGHDEEIGGHDGAARIARHLQQRGVRLHWVLDEGGLVLNDSEFLGGPAASISTAEKGYLSLKLVARAPGGHSSQPGQRTAVGLLAEAIDDIQKQPFPARLQSPTTDMLDIIGGETDGSLRYLVTN